LIRGQRRDFDGGCGIHARGTGGTRSTRRAGSARRAIVATAATGQSRHGKQAYRGKPGPMRGRFDLPCEFDMFHVSLLRR